MKAKQRSVVNSKHLGNCLSKHIYLDDEILSLKAACFKTKEVL